jgi:hypothetical protein
MRRKVEILSYKGNRMTSQTNAATTHERYAALMTGAYQRRTFSKTYIKQNTLPDGTISISNCDTLPTLTSQCDVPGPVTALYYDPNVPLVGLIPRYTYDEQNQNIQPDPWFFTSAANAVIQNTTSMTAIQYSTVVSLFLLKPVNPVYTYTLTFPYCVAVRANRKSYAPPSYAGGDITVGIVVGCDVFYDTEIYARPAVQQQMATFRLTPTSGAASYSADVYCGTATVVVRIAGITGQIYDFRPHGEISWTFGSSDNYSAYFETPTASLTMNCLTETTTSTGCTVTRPITPANAALSFTGV